MIVFPVSQQQDDRWRWQDRWLFCKVFATYSVKHSDIADRFPIAVNLESLDITLPEVYGGTENLNANKGPGHLILKQCYTIQNSMDSLYYVASGWFLLWLLEIIGLSS